MQKLAAKGQDKNQKRHKERRWLQTKKGLSHKRCKVEAESWRVVTSRWSGSGEVSNAESASLESKSQESRLRVWEKSG